MKKKTHIYIYIKYYSFYLNKKGLSFKNEVSDSTIKLFKISVFKKKTTKRNNKVGKIDYFSDKP